MEKRDVYLSSKELELLFSKYPKIGLGTEGTLFYVGKCYVYKVYHDLKKQIDLNLPKIYDAEGVNIAKVSLKNQMKWERENFLSYYDQENVKIFKKEALEKAIERQKNIKLTSLPLGILYVNNKLRGCVLKYHSLSTNIFNIRFFNQKTKLQIFKKILLRMEELINHNIYHMDIAQKPTLESKNTNILFRWNFVPEIVDLEGKSTIYTESYSEPLLKKVEMGLNILFFELLSKEDIEEDFLDVPEEIMSEVLRQNGFPDEMISDFYQERLTMDRLGYYTEILQRKFK